MPLEKLSRCKVNLVLNILGKRPDGFHELETIMHPVNCFDRIRLEPAARGITLTCSEPALPTDARNLAYRAAERFFQAAQIREGVRIHLEKRIPLAAGLGGGSGNAATTLAGLNELFGRPLQAEQLHDLAAGLGSDVPFFLQTQPALATGRGEQIQPLEFFRALKDVHLVLAHPGFGIATSWAYQQLAQFPAALNGRPGRAQQLLSLLQQEDLPAAAAGLYNSLEAPALQKFPLLALLQEFMRAQGAAGALMSGSGSTTFALCASAPAAESLGSEIKRAFGEATWVAVVPLERAPNSAG